MILHDITTSQRLNIFQLFFLGEITGTYFTSVTSIIAIPFIEIEIEIEIEIIYFQIKNQKIYNQNTSIYNTSKYIKIYIIYSL